MTTIPNINIVIQQGDSIRDSHNIKNHALDATQHTVFQRMEDDDKKRTVVSETDETEKILLNNEKSGSGKHKRGNTSEREKKKQTVEDDVFDPDAPGHLLNTIV